MVFLVDIQIKTGQKIVTTKVWQNFASYFYIIYIESTSNQHPEFKINWENFTKIDGKMGLIL